MAVLAYNFTRVMNILGVRPQIGANLRTPEVCGSWRALAADRPTSALGV